MKFTNSSIRRFATSSLRALGCLSTVVGVGDLARAQFVETNPGFPESPFPCVVPGDFDHDGDEDLFVAGEGSQGTVFSRIYRNTNGVFADSGIALAGLSTAAAAWGDFDHDGDLDVAMTGLTTNGVTSTRVYRNDGTVFTPVTGTFTGVYGGALSWGDVDLDGDLDLVVTGVTAQFFPAAVVTTKLYRNDAGSFVSIAHPFQDTYLGPVHFVDVDHDGDSDLFLGGNGTLGTTSTLWRNDAGVFVAAAANLPGVSLGDVDFGDYDGDGDLDVVVAGSTNNGYEALIYRNDAGVFTDIAAGLLGVVWADAAWGDYDLDGDLDVLVMGYDPVAQVPRTILYRNDAGTFVDSGATFHDLYLGHLDWLDTDLDGDLDFVIAGNDQGNDVTRLYRNSASVGAGFCFGDGTATACPCGNVGLVRRGCANSLGASGHLIGSGRASLANDTVVLSAEGMPNGPALYFQGTTRLASSAGVVFGDGLRCAGGTVIRLGIQITAGGVSRYPSGADASVSVRGLVGGVGLREYQVWYRDSAAFCSASTFNLTNGLELTWTN